MNPLPTFTRLFQKRIYDTYKSKRQQKGLTNTLINTQNSNRAVIWRDIQAIR